eukprot:4524463-Pyramimonas_sp.AAC.1
MIFRTCVSAKACLSTGNLQHDAVDATRSDTGCAPPVDLNGRNTYWADTRPEDRRQTLRRPTRHLYKQRADHPC